MNSQNIMLAIGSLLFAGNITAHAAPIPAPKKILIAYFSHSGNTREIAVQIKNATGGDLFEITPVAPYPTDYNAVVDQAKKEINSDYRPPLKAKNEHISDYDVIFVGSPNWWSTIAPPVATFLSSHDLAGKTIVPFMTHEGSGMGRSVSDIKKLCQNSTVLEGLPIRGKKAKTSQNTVLKWLQDLGVAKE